MFGIQIVETEFESNDADKNYNDIFRGNAQFGGRPSELLAGSVVDTNRTNGRFNTQRKDAHEEFFKMLVLAFKMNNV